MPLNLVILAAVLLFGEQPRNDNRFDPKSVDFFEKNVRPLLVSKCHNCHSASTNTKGGLRVDDRAGLVQGGNRGPAVLPGDPENSLLMQAVRYTDEDLKMPPKKRLSDDEIAILSKWVKDGAAWTQVDASALASRPSPKYDRLRKEHWAWQPLKVTAPPAVRDASWPRFEVDRFVLAKLEQAGLKPVGDADKLTLIRRVSFDLTGLPPTPEAIELFIADHSLDAFEKVVNRLLAAPAFGERWGRHWLDVARYGESTGSSRNLPFPHAWRYRDYVVDAINLDKPFDEFIREQIAGDLLPSRSTEERDLHRIATGFLALGVKDVNQRFRVRFIMDNVDEQIDAVSRSFLATTASCARCHDHKFDPIPTADYYALAGIFRSTDLCAGLRNKMGGGGLDYYDTTMLMTLVEEQAKPDPARAAKIAELTRSVAAARKEFEAIRGTPLGLSRGPDGLPKQRPYRLKLLKLERELLAFTDPANGSVALGVRDSKSVSDTEIRVRGEAEQLGPIVPRGFLSVVQVADAKPVNSKQSGRLELAQWIANASNPLTSRVIVNRVWQHLFNEGLVKSVDNFGSTGDVPSHPELLDYLAARFVREGWSVKKLVRQLVSSRVYRLGALTTAKHIEIDPSNRLLWRHAPRRLHAEEIRDATLAATGTLILARPRASAARDLKVMELPDNGPIARRIEKEARDSVHRSVYLPLLRGVTPTSLEVFDFAEQGMVTGRRDATTVATQALFMLNDPFVRRQSLNLAERLLGRDELDDHARVNLAFESTLGRRATAAEFDFVESYVSDYTLACGDRLAWAAPAQPMAALSAVAANDNPAETKKPAVPVNPDEVVQVEAPVVEEVIRPRSPEIAAWASFCQALLGSAEFRYVK
jgi:hypothetical protein